MRFTLERRRRRRVHHGAAVFDLSGPPEGRKFKTEPGCDETARRTGHGERRRSMSTRSQGDGLREAVEVVDSSGALAPAYLFDNVPIFLSRLDRPKFEEISRANTAQHCSARAVERRSTPRRGASRVPRSFNSREPRHALSGSYRPGHPRHPGRHARTTRRRSRCMPARRTSSRRRRGRSCRRRRRCAPRRRSTATARMCRRSRRRPIRSPTASSPSPAAGWQRRAPTQVAVNTAGNQHQELEPRGGVAGAVLLGPMTAVVAAGAAAYATTRTDGAGDVARSTGAAAATTASSLKKFNDEHDITGKASAAAVAAAQKAREVNERYGLTTKAKAAASSAYSKATEIENKRMEPESRRCFLRGPGPPARRGGREREGAEEPPVRSRVGEVSASRRLRHSPRGPLVREV